MQRFSRTIVAGLLIVLLAAGRPGVFTGMGISEPGQVALIILCLAAVLIVLAVAWLILLIFHRGASPWRTVDGG